MFDLKTGDTVLHKGVKRTVIQTRMVCGRKLLHLDNGGPMVRAENVIQEIPPSPFNPKIGDTVFFDGGKHEIVMRGSFGWALSGTHKCPPTRYLKPVIRLTEEIRAQMLVSYIGDKIARANRDVRTWVAVHHPHGVRITRKEYDAALVTLARGI